MGAVVLKQQCKDIRVPPLGSIYDQSLTARNMTQAELEYLTVLGSAIFHNVIDELITCVFYGKIR